MTAMGGSESMRAFSAAQKFIGTMDPSVLMAVMAFQGGAVRVKTDFTDDRAQLDEVLLRLIYGDDLDGDGFPDNPETGTAFGQDDAEFNIFNTDRQLSALQTGDVDAAVAVRAQDAGVFLERAQAQRYRQPRAAARDDERGAQGERVDYTRSTRAGSWRTPPLGDASRPSPGGMQMFTGQGAVSLANSFQRTQDTLYALSKDTGGNAMFDYNDLSLGIVRAAESLTSYYIIGYYSTHTAPDGRFRRVRVSLDQRDDAPTWGSAPATSPTRRSRGSRRADKERQLEEALMLENPVTDIAIAMEVNYLPAQPRRVLRPGWRQDSRQ